MFSFKKTVEIKKLRERCTKILLSTFRALLIICTIFGENQIFRVLATKGRDMRIIKCHVNNKVRHACFQLAKTGKEQLQVKVSWQVPRLCVSRFYFPLVSVDVLSTCVNMESGSRPCKLGSISGP